MPIYEYQCTSCDHKLEAIQKFSDAPLTECPACSTSSLRKLLSAPSFRLKGTGWYETDFKGGKSSPAKGDAGTKETTTPAKETAPANTATGGEKAASGS